MPTRCRNIGGQRLEASGFLAGPGGVMPRHVSYKVNCPRSPTSRHMRLDTQLQIYELLTLYIQRVKHVWNPKIVRGKPRGISVGSRHDNLLEYKAQQGCNLATLHVQRAEHVRNLQRIGNSRSTPDMSTEN